LEGPESNWTTKSAFSETKASNGSVPLTAASDCRECDAEPFITIPMYEENFFALIGFEFGLSSAICDLLHREIASFGAEPTLLDGINRRQDPAKHERTSEWYAERTDEVTVRK
jgi:hypothetical protein